MDYATPLGIIALAGLVHASLQLGVSMMTLLSGHSLSATRSARRALRLVACFFCGAVVMTMLIVALTAFILSRLWSDELPIGLWAIASSLLLGLGIVVWLIYYRPARRGTELWLPRPLARFLTHRTKATRDGAEAFSLGLTSVMAEFPFVLPPVFVASLAMSTLPVSWQIPGLAAYTIVASLGLGVVLVLLGSGHRISTIQRWREAHKTFLQFAAGGGLIVLGFFVYVTYVLVPMTLQGGM
jgi:hypothetical protein